MVEAHAATCSERPEAAERTHSVKEMDDARASSLRASLQAQVDEAPTLRMLRYHINEFGLPVRSDREMSPSEDPDLRGERGPVFVRALTNYVQSVMRVQYAFSELTVPLLSGVQLTPVPGKQVPPHCKILMTRDWSRCSTLLVVVPGHASSDLQPGMWSRSLCMDDGIYAGSMLPLVHHARQRGWGVAVLNPNTNFMRVLQPGFTVRYANVPIECSSTPERHVAYVWDNYLKISAARRVVIFAHSVGGVALLSVLKRRPAALQRIVGACFADLPLREGMSVEMLLGRAEDADVGGAGGSAGAAAGGDAGGELEMRHDEDEDEDEDVAGGAMSQVLEFLVSRCINCVASSEPVGTMLEVRAQSPPAPCSLLPSLPPDPFSSRTRDWVARPSASGSPRRTLAATPTRGWRRLRSLCWYGSWST